MGSSESINITIMSFLHEHWQPMGQVRKLLRHTDIP